MSLCLPIVLFGEVKRKNGGRFFFLAKHFYGSGISLCKVIYSWFPSISFQAVNPGFDSKVNFGEGRI